MRKYYLVFSDCNPDGAVLTAAQVKRIKNYKTVVEIDEAEWIPLINEQLDVLAK